MKKPNLVACLVILLTFSAPALAAGAPGSTGAPGGGAPGAAAAPSTGNGAGVVAGPQGGHEGGGALTPEKLASIKAGIIKHMDSRIADIQKRKQCVEAATTGEALQACIPNRPGRGGPKGGPEKGDHDGKPQ